MNNDKGSCYLLNLEHGLPSGEEEWGWKLVMSTTQKATERIKPGNGISSLLVHRWRLARKVKED